MNLCSRGHEEVCYEVADCPTCEAIENVRAEMQKEIDRLNKEIDTHECSA